MDEEMQGYQTGRAQTATDGNRYVTSMNLWTLRARLLDSRKEEFSISRYHEY